MTDKKPKDYTNRRCAICGIAYLSYRIGDATCPDCRRKSEYEERECRPLREGGGRE